MKLATVRTSRGPTYGIVTDKGFVDLGARLGSRYPDLKSLIAARAFAEAQKLVAEKPDLPLAELTWLPVIPNPGKILCVGLNYQEHVAETGRDNTEQPAFFIRVAESQVGHRQPLLRLIFAQGLSEVLVIQAVVVDLLSVRLQCLLDFANFALRGVVLA